VDASRDLADDLQSLVDHLMEFSESTSVYIGKVCCPMNKIKEDDDDTAHIKPDGVPYIKFTNACEQHAYMVDKVLL